MADGIVGGERGAAEGDRREGVGQPVRAAAGAAEPGTNLCRWREHAGPRSGGGALRSVVAPAVRGRPGGAGPHRAGRSGALRSDRRDACHIRALRQGVGPVGADPVCARHAGQPHDVLTGNRAPANRRDGRVRIGRADDARTRDAPRACPASRLGPDDSRRRAARGPHQSGAAGAEAAVRRRRSHPAAGRRQSGHAGPRPIARAVTRTGRAHRHRRLARSASSAAARGAGRAGGDGIARRARPRAGRTPAAVVTHSTRGATSGGDCARWRGVRGDPRNLDGASHSRSLSRLRSSRCGRGCSRCCANRRPPTLRDEGVRWVDWWRRRLDWRSCSGQERD